MFPHRWIYLLFAGILAALVSALPAAAYMENVPRMDKEALKAMLDSPDLLLVDIRTGMDWNASEFKIPGAVRYEPRNFNTWKDQLPEHKTMVLYCA